MVWVGKLLWVGLWVYVSFLAVGLVIVVLLVVARTWRVVGLLLSCLLVGTLFV